MNKKLGHLSLYRDSVGVSSWVEVLTEHLGHLDLIVPYTAICSKTGIDTWLPHLKWGFPAVSWFQCQGILSNTATAHRSGEGNSYINYLLFIHSYYMLLLSSYPMIILKRFVRRTLGVFAKKNPDLQGFPPTHFNQVWDIWWHPKPAPVVDLCGVSWLTYLTY